MPFLLKLDRIHCMLSRMLIISATLLFMLTVTIPAYAEEKPSKAKTQNELQKIQEQLKGVKKKEKEAAKQERSVLTDLENMDQNLEQKRAEVRKLEGKLNGVSREIEGSSSEMEKYGSKVKTKEADLANRIRAMYKTERAGGAWVLLVSGDYGSLLRRYKYLSIMSRRDKAMMEAYKGDLEKVADYNDKLKDQRKEYDKIKTARDAEAAKVQAQEAEKKKLLASIREKKGLYEAMAHDLEESGRRMRDLLNRLEVEKKAKPSPGKPAAPAVVVPALTAGLDWPVSGKIISFFGKQKHPEYDTYIFKNGVEIQAPAGSDVRAIDGAVVAFASFFKGLGQVAILRHGGDMYTVYAHLADVRVKAGDKVGKGQVIASLADTGSSTGPTLYFEVRKGAEPQDPVKWLKRKK